MCNLLDKSAYLYEFHQQLLVATICSLSVTCSIVDIVDNIGFLAFCKILWVLLLWRLAAQKNPFFSSSNPPRPPPGTDAEIYAVTKLGCFTEVLGGMVLNLG